MTSKKLAATLNDLLNGELRAHHAYLQTAAWAAEASGNLETIQKSTRLITVWASVLATFAPAMATR